MRHLADGCNLCHGQSLARITNKQRAHQKSLDPPLSVTTLQGAEGQKRCLRPGGEPLVHFSIIAALTVVVEEGLPFTFTMPALLVDTSDTTTSTASTESTSPSNKSTSPNRPPVEPISPTKPSTTASTCASAAAPRTQPLRPIPATATATFRRQPPSLPISESENPDAIALRSAISLLQLQRDKSKRHLQALEQLKAAAISNPQGFVRSLHEQRAQAASTPQDVLTPTLAPSPDATGAESTNPARIPAIPQPQNVIRCPPVNWAKYHVVGESLDKMHEEQRKYPGAAEPPRTQQGARAPPHAVAAPYSPFADGIGEAPTQTQQPTGRAPKKSPL